MIDLMLLSLVILIGLIAGTFFEKSHFRSIIKREARYRHILVVTTRSLPQLDNHNTSVLVTGSVVISVDYFKRFMAAIRSILGGRVKSYETLLERARREAVLRMKARARSLGAKQIFNVKYETASISKNSRGGIGSIEVLAYGTAFIPVKT